ncbi:Uncharacterized protein OBRU01_20597 [Operophtera brumata]|uniref:Prokaryotic-type class I peptide chain release factors domain-containing protein n=1 Tax=Operophtera brumata TaxID=104452 RepID=A0A0L7KWJ4_OPEBR|nr:Uncharacterized protein OBRU01_20597 [Operophtera brumata]
MQVARLDILRLYKDLMLYSRRITLTDPAYFRRRVVKEFKNNKILAKENDITFAYQVQRNIYCIIQYSLSLSERSSIAASWIRCVAPIMFLMNLIKKPNLLNRFQHVAVNFKHTIDHSKVPKVNELDLTEQFIRGSGPGGSAVNKNSNCVVLTHVPTGTVIKCHLSRSQDVNRKTARELLIAKLDEMENGTESVAAQKKRIEEKKYKKTEYKKKKIAQLKSEWKKREGLA